MSQFWCVYIYTSIIYNFIFWTLIQLLVSLIFPLFYCYALAFVSGTEGNLIPRIDNNKLIDWLKSKENKNVQFQLQNWTFLEKSLCN